MNDPVALRDARSYRLSNIDMLRGLVIVIMAIDHVRDFFMLAGVQDPMALPEVPASIYLTRWVTHFCAPVFVFLAGTSAGLMAARKSRHELAAFLCKRGAWLIFVEVFIISTAWTFSPFAGVPELGGSTLFILQVIWAIGASMIVLAGCQYLGARACFFIGAVIVFGHNALDASWPVGQLLGGSDPLWYGLHSQSSTVVGSVLVVTAYPLLPWIGVMLLGYGTASVFEKPPEAQNRTLLNAGIIMICAFVIIRATGLYGDPNPWHVQDAGLLASVYDFMNLSKYPPSLLFLLATLGPMAMVCAYADRMSGPLKDALVMFGRVPFLFYVAHWYLIRLLSFALAAYQGFEPNQMMTFFFFFPADYGVSLSWVYVIWVLVLVLLYPICKWMA
ncbi:MAG: heparan-alpha-glucosaminide N-acetyltransferase domain-containing protein, partial [Halioglobus sp.]